MDKFYIFVNLPEMCSFWPFIRLSLCFSLSTCSSVSVMSFSLMRAHTYPHLQRNKHTHTHTQNFIVSFAELFFLSLMFWNQLEGNLSHCKVSNFLPSPSAARVSCIFGDVLVVWAAISAHPWIPESINAHWNLLLSNQSTTTKLILCFIYFLSYSFALSSFVSFVSFFSLLSSIHLLFLLFFFL